MRTYPRSPLLSKLTVYRVSVISDSHLLAYDARCFLPRRQTLILTIVLYKCCGALIVTLFLDLCLYMSSRDCLMLTNCSLHLLSLRRLAKARTPCMVQARFYWPRQQRREENISRKPALLSSLYGKVPTAWVLLTPRHMGIKVMTTCCV